MLPCVSNRSQKTLKCVKTKKWHTSRADVFRPHFDVFSDLLIGSFSNDHGDGKEDVKKAIGLLRKTTTLHVHHAFCTFLYRPCTTTT